jgi:CelD/BcsL family acetyltransferase involved in cellulose biosynthesis
MADEGPGSEYLGVLCRPGSEGPFLAALGAHAAEDCSLVDLRGLVEGGALTSPLARAFASRSSGRVHWEPHASYRVPLPQDHETYLRSLTPKFRSTIRYRTNKLLKNTHTRLLRTETPAELEEHLCRLFELHGQRWRCERRPGVFHDLSQRAFYRDFAPAFLRQGWLRFFHLEVEGVIRASQIGFAFGGVFFSLQEAFDPSYRPQGIGGLGVVLRGLAIRECIAEGLSAYDFLGWAGEIKARWGTETLSVQRFQAASPGLAGALAFAYGAGSLIARGWIRRRAPQWVRRVRDAIRDRVLVARSHSPRDEP